MSKRNGATPKHSPLTAIGPGILFAGAAIGVSHLIQATRAGASFGLSLLLLILIIHLLKYPALAFAPRYVAATGNHLLHAYKKQGTWAVITFAIAQVGTMFTIVAAIAIVTAQVSIIAIQSISNTTINLSLTASAAILFAISATLLATGGYKLLESTIKALMALMFAATLAAAIAVLPDTVSYGLMQGPTKALTPDLSNAALVAFAIPLVGWMPAPLDISVWNSLWCKEQSKSRGRHCTKQEANLDFNTGYILCAITAACFLIMGAALIYYPGIEPATGNAPLVQQLQNLYAAALGSWITPLIALGAIAVMFSTTITVVDALPRTLIAITDTFRQSPPNATNTCRKTTHAYWFWFVLLSAGALVIINQFTANLRTLVDLATTLSFIATPLIAYLNHRAIFSSEVPNEHKPKSRLRYASLLAIVLFTISAIAYIGWLLTR